jgi:very-short-patch-repair endonuclease
MSIERAKQLRRNLTGPERKLWSALRLLRPEGFFFRRQAPFEAYVLDFVSHRERLVVEVDGSQHLEEKQRTHDEVRTQFLESRGYIVVRYTNYEVLQNLPGVMDHLYPILRQRAQEKFVGLPVRLRVDPPLRR